MNIPILNLNKLEEIAMKGCDIPNCPHDHDGEVWLNQRCHPGAGLEAQYVAGSGVVRLVCHKCKKDVLSIKAAEE